MRLQSFNLLIYRGQGLVAIHSAFTEYLNRNITSLLSLFRRDRRNTMLSVSFVRIIVEQGIIVEFEIIDPYLKHVLRTLER